MVGYLLFSHGSLLCGAGQALDEHTSRLRKRFAPSPVEAGYLNYSEPDVEVAVKRLVDSGAAKIVVIPYFLVPGYFVTTSLPRRLSEITPKYPSLEVKIACALETDERLAEAVVDMIGTARSPQIESADVLASAGAACRLMETCPLYGGTHCPRFMGTEPPVTPVSKEPVVFSPDTLRKTALMVMIHGSPKETANQPMLDVLEMIRRRDMFACVQPAFMECNAPDIPTALSLCGEKTVERIIAVPYFLHLGSHVAEDLPNLLIQGRKNHPDIEILMTDYLGRSSKVTDVLADRASALKFVD